jgi:hypothetical protein
VATEQDAARDRVLAAREDLAEQLVVLDIPAGIRRSPGKAAALAGGLGFLALKGPQRLFGAGRRAVRGEPAPMPDGLLPKDVEKTLRSLGPDGRKVRAVLERDFAAYAKQAQKSRRAMGVGLLLTALRPLLVRGSKVAADALLTPDGPGFAEQLARIRGRTERGTDATSAPDGDPGSGGAPGGPPPASTGA